MNTSNATNTTPVVTSTFLPQFLVALSIGIFFGWQVFSASRQYFALMRVSDQQSVLVNQAAQTEAKIQSMMTDLLKLSATDADAKAIATKYRITYTPPRQPALPEQPAGGQNVPAKASPDKNAGKR